MNAEDHVKDNNQSKYSKHLEGSDITQILDDNNSTSNSPGVAESMLNDIVEGEHLDSNTHIQGEHSFEGEKRRMNEDVEGEQHNQNNNDTISLDLNDELHEINDNLSVANLENKDLYEDTHLDFDPA